MIFVSRSHEYYKEDFAVDIEMERNGDFDDDGDRK